MKIMAESTSAPSLQRVPSKLNDDHQSQVASYPPPEQALLDDDTYAGETYASAWRKVSAVTEIMQGRAYVPGFTVAEYVSLIAKEFPGLADTLWFEREGAIAELSALCESVNEFESNDQRGRGVSYRRAQRHAMVREQGIRSLCALAADVPSIEAIPCAWTMLDVLGGDGLIAKVVRTLAPQAPDAVITGDMAGHMVAEALDAGLPAIRQRGQFLFMRDASVDAVLLAYGTHHIPRQDRLAVCQEAMRVLRPGGRLVLHDFEEGSPVTSWFSEVVHPYSRAGHEYDHFSVEELEHYLSLTGFASITIRRLYDPLVMSGSSPDTARSQLSEYLLDMYGLDYVATQLESKMAAWKLAEAYFTYDDDYLPGYASAQWCREPAVYRCGPAWIAEVPRVALVAVAVKALASRVTDPQATIR
jgi:SAM-dependent methyltransferase